MFGSDDIGMIGPTDMFVHIVLVVGHWVGGSQSLIS